jgi:fibrillarin-like rRNA methylase
MIAVKARSIDATAAPQKIFDKVAGELESDFEVVQRFRLEPYDKDHQFLLLRKK